MFLTLQDLKENKSQCTPSRPSSSFLSGQKSETVGKLEPVQIVHNHESEPGIVCTKTLSTCICFGNTYLKDGRSEMPIGLCVDHRRARPLHLVDKILGRNLAASKST